MVIDVFHLLELGEVGEQAVECLFAQGQVVKFVLEDDTRVVESVLNQEVAGFNLLLGEGDLSQIVFTLVRVVLCAVGYLFQRVLCSFDTCDGVEGFLREVFARAAHTRNDCLVGSLPVVDVLALTPQSLECLFSLLNRHRVVEVPFALLL